MNSNFETYRPKGFGTVSTYLFAQKPEALIEFLQKAFYGEVLNTSLMPGGKIGNCIVQIGTTCIMISQARGEFVNMKTALYLFVEDVDSIYENALKNGATDSFAPAKMDYQDYQGGVIDPEGNYWWISKRLVHEPY